MKTRTCSILLVVGVASLATQVSHATNFSTIDLAPYANQRIQDEPLLGQRAQYPSGNLVFNGVPFHLAEVGPNAWSAWFRIDGDIQGLRILEVDVDIYGVREVYTLLNTFGGEDLPGTFATIQFFGDDFAFYEKTLDGNSDIRDYLFGEFTNSINNSSTVNVFSVGSGFGDEVRLDMQKFSLPEEFHTQALRKIRFVDMGETGPDAPFQRLLLSGITVDSVPEPTSVLLFCGTIFLIGYSGREQRRRGQRRHQKRWDKPVWSQE